MELALRVLNELECAGVLGRYAIGGQMGIVEGMTPEIARLLHAKAQRRRELARLSFPQKVRMVVRLQEMAAPILRARGRSVTVWPTDAP